MDREAFESRERELRSAQNWSQLESLYAERSHDVFDPDELVALHAKRAELLHEQLDDLSRAAVAYRDVLVLQPEHEGALEALTAIYEARRDHYELAEILALRADVSFEPEEMIALRAQLATLYEERLTRPTSAIDQWEFIRDISPEHEGALEALSRLYRKDRRWRDLEALLWAAIDAGHVDDSRRAQLLYEIGCLEADELLDHHAALSTFRTALEADPFHDEARERASATAERLGVPANLPERPMFRADDVEFALQHDDEVLEDVIEVAAAEDEELSIFEESDEAFVEIVPLEEEPEHEEAGLEARIERLEARRAPAPGLVRSEIIEIEAGVEALRLRLDSLRQAHGLPQVAPRPETGARAGGGGDRGSLGAIVLTVMVALALGAAYFVGSQDAVGAAAVAVTAAVIGAIVVFVNRG